MGEKKVKKMYTSHGAVTPVLTDNISLDSNNPVRWQFKDHLK